MLSTFSSRRNFKDGSKDFWNSEVQYVFSSFELVPLLYIWSFGEGIYQSCPKSSKVYRFQTRSTRSIGYWQLVQSPRIVTYVIQFKQILFRAWQHVRKDEDTANTEKKMYESLYWQRKNVPSDIHDKTDDGVSYSQKLHSAQHDKGKIRIAVKWSPLLRWYRFLVEDKTHEMVLELQEVNMMGTPFIPGVSFESLAL